MDKGFEGQAAAQRWRDCYGAWVICPPRRNSRNPWPKGLHQWLAGIRQMVETVFDKLHHAFRLDWERPHQLEGFQTRVATQVALHNFCIWLNRQLGRPWQHHLFHTKRLRGQNRGTTTNFLLYWPKVLYIGMLLLGYPPSHVIELATPRQ